MFDPVTSLLFLFRLRNPFGLFTLFLDGQTRIFKNEIAEPFQLSFSLLLCHNLLPIRLRCVTTQ